MYVFHTNQGGSTMNNQSNFLFFVAGTCNMILLFVSNGNLKLLFLSLIQVVAIKTDESVTFVHTVRINKLEVNLAERREKVWTFLNVFSGILIFYINGNP